MLIESSLPEDLLGSRPIIELVGTEQPTAFSALIASLEETHSARAQVIQLANDQLLEQFELGLNFFAPHLKVLHLPAFDVSPYGGLYPHRLVSAKRLRWLFEAQRSSKQWIFTCTPQSLSQKTLPYSALSLNVKTLIAEDELPEELTQWLDEVGYQAVPIVEDVGTYSLRGGLLDIFSPAFDYPIRLQLFGDLIESMRYFDPLTGKSLEEVKQYDLIPASEIFLKSEDRQSVLQKMKGRLSDGAKESETFFQIQNDLLRGNRFSGIEFLLPDFYDDPALPLDHFNEPLHFWNVSPQEIMQASDQYFEELKQEWASQKDYGVSPDLNQLFSPNLSIELDKLPEGSKWIEVMRLKMHELDDEPENFESVLKRKFLTDSLSEFTSKAQSLIGQGALLNEYLGEKIEQWKSSGQAVFIAASSEGQSQRIQVLLENLNYQPQLISGSDRSWEDWKQLQLQNRGCIHIITASLKESFSSHPSQIVCLSEETLFGRKRGRTRSKKQESANETFHAAAFSDLKSGDHIVHKTHGVGIYQGLKVMSIQGIDKEFLHIEYKDKDKLYLPVYRIGQVQKYSGPTSHITLDKLGGLGWEKTKTKVRAHLKDIAAELIKLYSQRAQIERPAFAEIDADFRQFEASFPYQETPDQERAVNDIIDDLTHLKPMDRLICGDVGFGKTEVAMRAAFKVVQGRKQVAVIAPTTVLTFQHVETFKKRFKDWPIVIRGIHRFVPKGEAQKILKETSEGKVDILIGTHRLLSKDVQFKELGLLVIDEEQKFGVRHKERLKKMKVSVDTLAMSATPIPRSLNMSLMGIRDLSVINTAPVDRLPTRTFICKYDPEIIRKAVSNEIQRGGQVFFIHNRVQSIYGLADDLKSFLPDARIGVAHGQMQEDELEKVMVQFFNHELDVLVCTTIIESGMDIPRANTMFIDQAHQLGLSQLYQLRGRVGRSKERAYCYLMVPRNLKLEKIAQERLKVIQENTALGSGFKIANYDLELRGAGDLLGEDQSGQIKAVGYELYLELLDEAIRENRGDPKVEDLDPEINLPFAAFIPDNYIEDIRIRLSFYKALAGIKDLNEVDEIEDQMRDQFGKPPEQVMNLMGIMSIRKICKDLSIKDLSAGPKSIALSFTEHTSMSPERIIELTSRPTKKYSITPDSRLVVRMQEITWPRVFDELVYLQSLTPK